MRPSGSPAVLENRRYEAIALLEEGYQPVEVAKRLGVDRRSVRRWKASKTKKGLAALKAKPSPGRPSQLQSKQKEKLRQIILRGAEANGFTTALWTCPRIAELIHRKFGVRYHVDHVSRLLHSLGFSPQKPERRAIERDEKGIRRWTKVHWPKIKKKPEN
jgi:transposase